MVLFVQVISSGRCTSLSALHSACLGASVFPYGCCISATLTHNTQHVLETVLDWKHNCSVVTEN